jgi:hypothetical protein
MEDCKIARQVAEWNPQGKRRHNRPVNTWDGIRDSMQRMKNVSIVSSGGRKLCLWVEEYCVPTENFLYMCVCVYIYIDVRLKDRKRSMSENVDQKALWL